MSKKKLGPVNKLINQRQKVLRFLNKSKEKKVLMDLISMPLKM